MNEPTETPPEDLRCECERNLPCRHCEPITDTDRIDFLASTDQFICNVTMPREIVEKNLTSLRDAIDECVRLEKPKNNA